MSLIPGKLYRHQYNLPMYFQHGGFFKENKNNDIFMFMKSEKHEECMKGDIYYLYHYHFLCRNNIVIKVYHDIDLKFVDSEFIEVI